VIADARKVEESVERTRIRARRERNGIDGE
jgi:hypothetical protein